MADHFRLKSYQLFNAQAVSSTTVYTSPTVNILNLDNVFLQFNVSGTPNGALSIQVSSDHDETAQGAVITPGNWIEVVSIPLTGSAINIGEDLNQLGAPWLRVVYTNTSSSGIISAFVSGKGLI